VVRPPVISITCGKLSFRRDAVCLLGTTFGTTIHKFRKARSRRRRSRAQFERPVLSRQCLGAPPGAQPPPLGLLQVAETIGGADWQPALMNFSDMLAQLIAELPEAMRWGTAVETVLRKSGDLADLEAVAQLVRGRSGNCPGDIRCTRAQPSKAYDLPLAERDCTASRQMGRPIFAALWMREAPISLSGPSQYSPTTRGYN